MQNLKTQLSNTSSNRKNTVIELKRKEKGDQKYTLFRSMKFHVELLHPVVHHLHLIIAHHPTKPKTKQKLQRNPQEIKQRWKDRRSKKQETNLQFHEVHFTALARRRHRDGILKIRFASRKFLCFLLQNFLLGCSLWETEEMRKAQWKGTKDKEGRNAWLD